MTEISDDTCPRRRGRPRIRRNICGGADLRCFAPQCNQMGSDEYVMLFPDELEILRLVDLDNLEQEEAALAIGVSRKTLWRDLHNARRKVADALIHGKRIEMGGCPRARSEECPKKAQLLCPKDPCCPCPCPYQDGDGIPAALEGSDPGGDL